MLSIKKQSVYRNKKIDIFMTCLSSNGFIKLGSIYD